MMPSPLPGMDPFLEKTPIFHELHTQMLAEIQSQLQTQVRPKYVARLERHLSEGSVWDLDFQSLDRKEPDVAIQEGTGGNLPIVPTAAVAEAATTAVEELPILPVPLLGEDRAAIDLAASFQQAYDRIAGDDEADYASSPPPPPLRDEDRDWIDRRLREAGFRR